MYKVLFMNLQRRLLLSRRVVKCFNGQKALRAEAEKKFGYYIWELWWWWFGYLYNVNETEMLPHIRPRNIIAMKGCQYNDHRLRWKRDIRRLYECRRIVQTLIFLIVQKRNDFMMPILQLKFLWQKITEQSRKKFQLSTDTEVAENNTAFRWPCI